MYIGGNGRGQEKGYILRGEEQDISEVTAGGPGLHNSVVLKLLTELGNVMTRMVIWAFRHNTFKVPRRHPSGDLELSGV